MSIHKSYVGFKLHAILSITIESQAELFQVIQMKSLPWTQHTHGVCTHLSQ